MSYAVVYLDEEGRAKDIVARGVWHGTADLLAGQLQPRAREGHRFTVRNENQINEEGDYA